MLILGIDPGVSTGYAFVEDGIVGEFGNIKGKEELFRWLPKATNVDVVVCEDYIVRPAKYGGFDHSFNKGFTLRIIGAIDLVCFAKGVNFVLQQPSIKSAANPMVFGKPYKKQQNRHWHDAHLHAMYYWRTQIKGGPQRTLPKGEA